MFSVNDTIIYRGKGVCTVSAIEERDFCGQKGLYYILKPVYQNSSTIYVFCDNPKLVAKMKKVLTPKEVDSIISSIPAYCDCWIDNSDQRKLYYKEITEKWDIAKILGVIRCIHKKHSSKSRNEKKPHIFDLQFMQENEKIVLEEISIALGITPAEANKYIEKQLGENTMQFYL